MIYMNNAASAWPKAPGVPEAVADALREIPGFPGRGAGFRQTGHADDCRRRLSQLLGCPPDRIVLTPNATFALNIAILGMSLKKNDEVLTSVTEHNSVLRPLARLEKLSGIKVTRAAAGPDGLIDTEEFERALRRGPRLVVLNHACNVTGVIQPAGKLFAAAKRAGAVTLLDASQTLGAIPVDSAGLSADIIAFTGHKALRGPEGAGGLFVSPEIELEQIITGGTGVRSDLEFHPPEMPLRLEAGTPNTPSLAGLSAALLWHETSGAAFRAAERDRTAQLLAGLRKIPHVRLLCGAASAPRVGIVSFTLDGWDTGEAGFALEKSFGVICRAGLHCAPLIHKTLGSYPNGALRLSPSGATTEAEIDFVLGSIRKMA